MILGKFSAYKLHLKNMPAGRQQFEFTADSEFFSDMESSDIRSGLVKIVVDVDHKGDIYVMDFVCKGTVNIPCDRCLDDMEHVVDTTYHLTVKYGDDYNDESDDLLIIPESDNDLNVAYMIYDTVELTIPLRHVHPEGECNKEMAARLKRHSANSEEESADDETESGQSEGNDPRWDALRNLLDNE